MHSMDSIESFNQGSPSHFIESLNASMTE